LSPTESKTIVKVNMRGDLPAASGLHSRSNRTNRQIALPVPADVRADVCVSDSLHDDDDGSVWKWMVVMMKSSCLLAAHIVQVCSSFH